MPFFVVAACLFSTSGCGDAVAATPPAGSIQTDSTGTHSTATTTDSIHVTVPADSTKASPSDSTKASPVDSTKPAAGVTHGDSATAPADTSRHVQVDSAARQPAAAHIVSLQLTAGAATLQIGATLQLSATATMSDGTSGRTATVQWTATGGTVTVAGLYTAGPASGAGSITATSGSLTATSWLTIAPMPAPLLPAVNAMSADAFVNSIGVNLHLGYFGSPYGTAWQSIIVPRLTQLGIRHARDGGTIVTDDGWMNSVYGRMQQLASQGIKFDLVLSPVVGTTDFASYSQLNRLMQFAAPVVESFEGLNEHDLAGRGAAWVSDVQTFQQAIYTALRADGRTAAMPIYGPSMGHPVNAAAVGNLSALFDVGNVHPYPGGNLPMANLASHESQLRAITGTGHPWVVTETGYHNAMTSTTDHPPVSENAMGRYIPRLVLGNFLAGVTRTYLYEFIDEGTDQANREQNFGLLRNDGSAKPAYTALQNLIAELSDPGSSFAPAPLRFSIAGDTTGIVTAVFAKRNGSYDVVMWQEVSSYNLGTKSDVSVATKPVTLKFTGSPLVRVFVPMLSASPQVGIDRRTSITVSVPDHPVVIEITP